MKDTSTALEITKIISKTILIILILIILSATILLCMLTPMFLFVVYGEYKLLKTLIISFDKKSEEEDNKSDTENKQQISI